MRRHRFPQADGGFLLVFIPVTLNLIQGLTTFSFCDAETITMAIGTA